MSRQTAKLHFPADHPAAAGHFPGNPMIPGAVLLDAVIGAIAEGRRDAEMLVRTAKFLHVVRPGDTLELFWLVAGDAISFEAKLEARLAVTGKIEMTT